MAESEPIPMLAMIIFITHNTNNWGPMVGQFFITLVNYSFLVTLTMIDYDLIGVIIVNYGVNDQCIMIIDNYVHYYNRC